MGGSVVASVVGSTVAGGSVAGGTVVGGTVVGGNVVGGSVPIDSVGTGSVVVGENISTTFSQGISSSATAPMRRSTTTRRAISIFPRPLRRFFFFCTLFRFFAFSSASSMIKSREESFGGSLPSNTCWPKSARSAWQLGHWVSPMGLSVPQFLQRQCMVYSSLLIFSLLFRHAPYAQDKDMLSHPGKSSAYPVYFPGF